MKRRSHLPNRKVIKRNVPGSERAKREGLWRAKDQKTSSVNKKDRHAK